ncbi:hypothetical protein N0V90_003866 [Kalmusia sp. IMI 367209]|nr:hypothetical protein N0V90_003866 [Kalmusia sp. IMI 367209]
MASEQPANKATRPPSEGEYAKAFEAGNVLQSLPLELRQCVTSGEVFAFAALGHLQSYNPSGLVEASKIRAERKCAWLPPMCHVNDDFFLESLPMFLRHVNVVVRESYTAYNLRFFLQATGTFPYIYSLRYTSSETLTPFFAGPQLLNDCINLRHVWLSFRLADFKFKPLQAVEFDRKSFLEDHSFRQLLALKHVEKVTLFIIRTPGEHVSIPAHLGTCWGVMGWLEKKFRRRNARIGRTVPVHIVGEMDELDPEKPGGGM